MGKQSQWCFLLLPTKYIVIMLVNSLLNNKTKIKSEYLDDYVWNLGDKTFQIPKEFTYQVIEVTEDFVARMDLISLHIYNTDKFSDVLCKINGISNPFELNVGDKLVIPEYSDMVKFFYEETPAESDGTETGEEIKKPKAKAKIDKRKPNEAIIGDKRYKVDKKSKVIIY